MDDPRSVGRGVTSAVAKCVHHPIRFLVDSLDRSEKAKHCGDEQYQREEPHHGHRSQTHNKLKFFKAKWHMPAPSGGD